MEANRCFALIGVLAFAFTCVKVNSEHAKRLVMDNNAGLTSRLNTLSEEVAAIRADLSTIDYTANSVDACKANITRVSQLAKEMDRWNASISKVDALATDVAAMKIKVGHVDTLTADVANCKAKLSTVDKLTSDLAAIKTQYAQINTLKSEVSTLNQRLDGMSHRVAFKAMLSAATDVAPNARIYFDHVAFNQGNGYNGQSGTFTAPYTGTYLLSVTMCSKPGHFIIVDLLNNNNMVGQVMAGDYGNHDCASESTVTALNQGDHVTVHHRYNLGDHAHADANMHSTFSGILIN